MRAVPGESRIPGLDLDAAFTAFDELLRPQVQYTIASWSTHDPATGLFTSCTMSGAQVGDIRRAAGCAFWSAFVLLNKGELARGGGWVQRGQRLLDGGDLDCVERGYLRYAASVRLAFEGDVAAAAAGFDQAAKIGEHFHAPEPLHQRLTTLTTKCPLMAQGGGPTESRQVGVGEA